MSTSLVVDDGLNIALKRLFGDTWQAAVTYMGLSTDSGDVQSAWHTLPNELTGNNYSRVVVSVEYQEEYKQAVITATFPEENIDPSEESAIPLTMVGLYTASTGDNLYGAIGITETPKHGGNSITLKLTVSLANPT